MNRVEKRLMIKFLLNLDVFAKKQVLFKCIEKNSNYTKEERADLILKIDKMNNDEIDDLFKEMIDFYV